MPQKTILYVVNDANFFISHRMQLATKAIEKGYAVEIATAPSSSCNLLIKKGFMVHKINFSRGRINPFIELLVVLQLFFLYRKRSPDIIHNITAKPIIYSTVALWFLKPIKVVNAVTGLGLIFSMEGFFAKISQWVLKKAYAISISNPNSYTIFQNPDDRTELLGHKKNKRCVIIRGAGVDPKQFSAHPEPNGPVVVMLASRMLWSKGVGEFIKTAKILLKDRVNCRCVLVGGLDYANPDAVSKNQLNRWHENKVIEWWGHCKDMPKTISQANIVVLPTKYREGVPKILIEAASSARPIICTDTAGCKEIVHDNQNGILVPPGDVISLVEAIKRLVKSQKLRKKFGKNGRELVIKQFSLELVLNNTFELYKHVLSDTSNTP